MNRGKAFVIVGGVSIALVAISKPKIHQASSIDEVYSQPRQGKFQQRATSTIINPSLISFLPFSFCDKTEGVQAPAESMNSSSRVVEMTQDTIASTVMNDDKDVFVVFYAPWCGYCKRLFPVWEALAAATKLNDKIVIGQVDMTKHEVTLSGVQIQGYPTIYYFPRGRLSRAIEYRSAREVAQLNQFVESCQYRQTAVDRGWFR